MSRWTARCGVQRGGAPLGALMGAPMEGPMGGPLGAPMGALGLPRLHLWADDSLILIAGALTITELIWWGVYSDICKYCMHACVCSVLRRQFEVEGSRVKYCCRCVIWVVCTPEFVFSICYQL